MVNRSDEEPHSIRQGWEYNRIGRKLGRYSHSGAGKISSSPSKSGLHHDSA